MGHHQPTTENTVYANVPFVLRLLSKDNIEMGAVSGSGTATATAANAGM